jgi:hypothetical protein
LLEAADSLVHVHVGIWGIKGKMNEIRVKQKKAIKPSGKVKDRGWEEREGRLGRKY